MRKNNRPCVMGRAPCTDVQFPREQTLSSLSKLRLGAHQRQGLA